MEPFPGKSKKVGRLAFRLTAGTVFELAFISWWRSFFLLFPAIFFIKPPSNLPDGIVIWLFIALTIIGYALVIRSSLLRKFPPVEVVQAREKLKNAYIGDWRIVKNNEQLFYAEKWQGQIRHYFFVIFDRKATYLSCIYSYPAPIAGHFEKTKIKELRWLIEATCNKNKN